MVSSSPRLGPWRDAITLLAKACWRGRPPLGGPVRVEITAVFPQFASAPASWRDQPDNRWPSRHGFGDADKLARAVLDALTAACVYGDDAQVVDLTISKRIAGGPGAEQDSQGARIRLWPVIP